VVVGGIDDRHGITALTGVLGQGFGLSRQHDGHRKSYGQGGQAWHAMSRVLVRAGVMEVRFMAPLV
jgi:hypothetical protein